MGRRIRRVRGRNGDSAEGAKSPARGLGSLSRPVVARSERDSSESATSTPGTVSYDPGPDVGGLAERYGIALGDRSHAREIQRLESEFGADRVERWADEGIPIGTMGKPRDMRAFREREAGNASDDSRADETLAQEGSVSRVPGRESYTEAVPSGRLPVQAKLEVSSADDPAEREAEAVAEAVVQATTSDPAEGIPEETVSRTAVHGKGCSCGRCGRVRLSRSTTDATAGADGTVDEQTESVVRAGVSGSGKPLPSDTRSEFESSMGAEFADVRVHTGADADAGARSIRAEAYTMGSDIAFSAGNYRPDSADGKRLLAHELTHVVQQGPVSRVQRAAAGWDGAISEFVDELAEVVDRIAAFAFLLEELQDDVSRDELEEADDPVAYVVEHHQDRVAAVFSNAQVGEQRHLFFFRFNAEVGDDVEQGALEELYDLADGQFDGRPGETRSYTGFLDELFHETDLSAEEKVDVVELRFGLDVQNDIDLVDAVFEWAQEEMHDQGMDDPEGVAEGHAEAQGYEGIDEYETARLEEILELLYDEFALLQAEGYLEEADVAEVVFDYEFGTGLGSFDPVDRRLTLFAQNPDVVEETLATIHEVGHALDLEGGVGPDNAEYSSREDFTVLSDWEHFEVGDTSEVVGELTDAVDDPYESVDGGEFYTDDEDAIDEFAQEVVGLTGAFVGVVPNTFNQIDANQVELDPAEEEPNVPDWYNGYTYMARVNLVDAILRAQASEGAWWENNFANTVGGVMSGTIVHQAYPGSYWYSYAEAARNHMVALSDDGYAARNPAEEFAEVFAHGVTTDRNDEDLHDPYGTWWSDVFLNVFEGEEAVLENINAVACGELEGE